MNWYPTRVLPSLAIVAGLTLGCAQKARTGDDQVIPTRPPPPPGSMKGTESARERSTTLVQLLQGRLAGVNVTPAPDGGVIVRMAGPTSFYGDQSPLFVVDGVTIDGRTNTLSWLDPHDVESVQALRDPTQTAIYGVRGANGVIVIRTKGSH